MSSGELVLLLVGYQPTGAVGYISYNMGTFDLPEIYTLALGPSCFRVYISGKSLVPML